MVTVASNLLMEPNLDSKYTASKMNDKQFERWVELLGSRIGVRASALRKTFLSNALGIRLQALELSNYDEYYYFLHTGIKGKIEWFELIDLLTIRETRFFRQAGSLKLLQNYVLEKLSTNIGNNLQSIKTWSVGCASGEEPYTIAIVLDQAIKSAGKNACYFSVIASDISHSSLKFAAKGVYAERQLKNMDENLIRQYFTKSGHNHYQISNELKTRVCFNKINVLDIKQNNAGLLDIIYCQNLLIYFEHEARINIINRLSENLAADGLLILGAGEIYQWDNPDMALINNDNNLAYRKSTSNNPGTRT